MLSLVLSAALAASAPQALAPTETSIDFASSGGIADWLERDERSLYVMDRPGRWYLATLAGQCWNLTSNETLKFEPGPTGRFDRFSAVVTRYGRCQLQSLVRTERPAEKGLKGLKN